MAETINERPTYIALLRDAEGNERAISFESPTDEGTHVGDEITIDDAEWQVLAIEQEDPPWAGVLVCERAETGSDRSELRSRLDDELPEEDPGFSEENLPLHLRVLRAILEGEPPQKRINQALALANEVYELEVNGEFED